MKANVRYGAVALLWIAACNRPDAALFDDVPGDDVNGTGGSTTAGTTASVAGSSTDAGGTGATASVGGSAPKAGSSGDVDAAGGPSPPDGMAGAPDNVAGSSNNVAGTAGTGEPPKPPEPVCGNGKLEAGEECDDSGHSGKDGCDACKVVCSDFGSDTLESDDHHCYNGYDAATFDGAIAACKERGAHLATVSSEAENKLAQKFVNNSKWLGGFEDVASNVQGTGNYGWLTEEPFTYTNWAKAQPDQAKVRCEGGIGSGPGPGPAASCYQHCVSMLGDGTWTDERCEVSDGYVCEWEPAGTK